MDLNPSPVIVQRVHVFPFGFDGNVMDNNEYDVDEFEAGFFGDDNMMPSRSAAVRSHLDDLASRHPEFADSLRGPPWASEMGGGARGGTWGHRRRGSGSAGEDDAASSSAASTMSDPHQDPQEQSDEPGPLRGRPRATNPLPQHAGVRNTVPDMAQRQQQEEAAEEARGQRSWSAPPDNRVPPHQQQRFVSRLDVNPAPAEHAPDAAGTQPQENQSKPPPAPKQSNAPQPPPKPTGNVRHIPIFVEGRDEPVVPKNIDAEPSSHEQHFTSQAQHHFQPHHGRQQQQQPQQSHFPPTNQKRPFQPQQNNLPQQKQQNRSFNASPKPFQQPNMQPQPHMQQQHQHPNMQQQNVPNFPPSQAEDSGVQAQPEHRPEPPPKVVLDPISRVQAIQAEVAGLKADVDRYTGTSRKDKEYIVMDEMLTRNLLKLDDIETEGREDIRNARKAAIRSIQECINTLEAKAPLPPGEGDPPSEQPMDESGSEQPQEQGMEMGESASGDTIVSTPSNEANIS